MSYWVLPTTADIGIRAFGRNKNDLLREITLGMQSILLQNNQDLNAITRITGRWEVSHDGDSDLLVIKWLDEVLYRAEVYDEFLLDCQPLIKDGMIEAQISFAPKDMVKLEIPQYIGAWADAVSDSEDEEEDEEEIVLDSFGRPSADNSAW